ncbi:dynein, axonemal, intermediate chain 1, paralog 2 isoform X2 [Pseudoliparis swirei]|uniref:dynein, axonemal, intermediate chain 1, paralog 2 isoform X2 n=1 Tax=Pseudoliparis swirei TaxID=2059687 RepID=UPI0024BEC2D1|nr:dynein, axonemal, intermediate chain 1, paralog 2 isoform X2 [Pseudoliparis swirei]
MPNNVAPTPGRKASVVPKATPPGPKTAKAASKKKDEDEGVDTGDDDCFYGRALARPPEQLELTEAELKEEITRILTANNPHAPQNIVRYSSKERSYTSTGVVDQMAVHLVLEGSLLHQDSDEARRLRAEGDLLKGAAALEPGAELEEGKPQTPATEGGGEVDEEDRPDSVASRADPKEPSVTNQFNFSERASQTLGDALRQRSCQTEPPPRGSFGATANQWEIYDAYVEELHKQERNKEKQKASKKEHEKSKKKTLLLETQFQNDDLTKMGGVAKILERMVTQNMFDGIAKDFKYFEDASDEFRDQKGTLLPLWRFQYDKARGLSVTALCWSQKYPDLFAVGMGSYASGQQGRGLLLFYSLKNSAFPEYIYPTDSGVLCLHIHQQHSYLVAVGFYDGRVAVYNLKAEGLEPAYRSTAKTGKHTDPVWQVSWQNDDMDQNHNFYSVSSDGRVVSWTLVKNELVFTDIITLSLQGGASEGPEAVQPPGVGQIWLSGCSSVSCPTDSRSDLSRVSRPQPVGRRLTSTNTWTTSSSLVRRRGRCTSAPRPTPARSWRPTTPTAWRWTPSSGTTSTPRSSSPAARTGP